MVNTNNIDKKYIEYVGRSIDQFKSINLNVYRCRCPLCGDSKKNKTRTRGFFYMNKGNWYYKCHNCGVAQSFSNFLKDKYTNLYKEYIVELFKAKGYVRKLKVPKDLDDLNYENKIPSFKKITELDLDRVDKMEEMSLAKRYLKSRKIPRHLFKLFYHTEGFKEFTNSVVEEKFESIEPDEPRLVIPFFNKDGELIAFQGRSYKKDAFVRYITIKVDESAPRVFGAERIDESKPIYATEGAIDSLFIPNCISFNGADIPTNIDPSKVISIYDNNPRNINIIKAIGKAIDRGFQVVIFPKTLKSGDINQMILSKEVEIENMLDFIKNHTYYGLKAKLELSNWRKI